MAKRTNIQGIVYRYEATFPRVVNKPRLPWASKVADRLDALPGMLSWSASDASNAWDAGGESLSESRHPVITVEIVAASDAEASARKDAFLALVGDLRDLIDHGTSVGVAGWRVDYEIVEAA